MLDRWLTPRILRLLHLSTVPNVDEIITPNTIPRLDMDQVRMARVVLLGAAWAARAEIRKNPSEEPVRFVDEDVATASFEKALHESPVGIRELTRVFLPTAFLYTDREPPPRMHLYALDDSAPPHDVMKGITFASESRRQSGASGSLPSFGDAFLVPPAILGEGRKRSKWLEASKLEPPRVSELGGAWWRLGETDLWRLWVLSWNEKLVLGALLGTRFESCIVLAPSRLFPRVGFVVEAARANRRTCVCIPLESCPPSLIEALEKVRLRRHLALRRDRLALF